MLVKIGNLLGKLVAGVVDVILPFIPILNIGNMGLEVDAASGTLVNGRSSTATVTDFEGNVVNCLANEIRYEGGRRVENLLNNSSDFSQAIWTKANGATATATSIDLSFATNCNVRQQQNVSVSAGDTYTGSIVLSGSGDIQLGVADGAQTDVTARVIALTSIPTLYAVTHTFTISSASILLKLGGNISTTALVIDVAEAQIELGGLPSEHVDNDTTYNAGIPSVRYFDYKNGNTVDGNGVVTEAAGGVISPAPTLLHEGAGTNLLKWSEDMTQWGDNGMLSTAETITRHQVGTSYMQSQIAVADSSEFFTLTARVKPLSTDNVSLRIQGTYPARVDVCFNVLNGTISKAVTANSFTGAFASITPAIDGWFDVSLTGKTITGATSLISFTSASSIPLSIDGTDVISTSSASIKYAHLRQSQYIDSYIPTTTAAVTRAADSINLPLSVGTNFVQEQGILLFKWKAGYDAASDYAIISGLLSLRSSTGSILWDRGGSINIRSTDGSSNALTNLNNWSEEDSLLFSVVWNSSESLFSLSYSLDNGSTWAFWETGLYGGTFSVGAFITLFYSNSYRNNLHSAIVYGTLPDDGTIAAAQTWVEENAGTLTNIAVGLGDELGNALADEAGLLII